MSAPGRPQVLYLTAVDRLTGAAGLSRETRIVVGVLARDFRSVIGDRRAH